MTTLRTKAARHQAIADILAHREIHTQDELRELVELAGFAVTQATLSRDLDEIGAVKVESNGRLVYALSDFGVAVPVPDAGSAGRLARVATEVVTAVNAAQNLVVVHTRPGAAQYLASAIDRDLWTNVVGSVAGDDTVLIVATDSDTAAHVSEQLRAFAGSRKSRKGANNG